MKRAALVVFLILLGALGVMRYLSLDVLLYQNWRLNSAAMPEPSLNLGRYRVDIEARVVEGLDDDLSALTYNRDRDSLATVINGEPLFLELDLEGRILRRVRVEGVSDMEGIAHVDGSRYLIAEERAQRLLLVDIPDNAQSVDTRNAPSLRLALDDAGNKGIEGVTWDDIGQRVLVVKERDPLRLIAIEGFVNADAHAPALRIAELQAEDSPGLFMSDLSSVSQHNATGHLLLLSDASHMLVEYGANYEPISLLGLWSGMSGLSATVPQAEGVAVDSQGRIYVVSEPNLFYRFVPH